MNVIKYGEDFIAFHGINEFKFVESEKTKSISRSGKNIVPPTKSSAAALDSFTRKVKGFTRDYGVLGKEETKVGQRKGSSIDFDSALSEKVSICCSKDGKVMTDTLRGWLSNPKTINPFGPPKGAKIVLANGKEAFALSKQVYVSLIAGTDTISTSDLLGGMDEDKQQMAIDAVNGAIFNHATRRLGKAVLETLYAGFGGHRASQHEGIVMWHKEGSKEIFNFPDSLKITGDFIVEGMGGTISQKMAKENPAQIKTEFKRKIAVFPGKFKPPHRGHMDLVKGKKIQRKLKQNLKERSQCFRASLSHHIEDIWILLRALLIKMSIKFIFLSLLFPLRHQPAKLLTVVSQKRFGRFISTQWESATR